MFSYFLNELDTEDYSVSLYQDGDEYQIVELLRQVFTYWRNHKDPLNYWLWRYRDNPVKRNIIVEAFYRDQVIGCSHNNSLRLKLGDELGLGYLVGGAAILEEHRGKGIYNKVRGLHNKIRDKEGSIFNYWITENPILINSDKRKADYHPFPFKIKQYVRINDPDTYFKIRNSGNGTLKKIAYKAATLVQSRPNNNHVSELEIRKIESIPTEMDQFWNDMSSSYSFILARDRDYLQWRYLDNRGGNYNVFLAELRGKIKGFLVARTRENNGLDECVIVDYLAIDEKILGKLVETACLDNKKSPRISCWTTNGSQADKLLPRMGFVYDRSKIYIGCQLSDDKYEELHSSDPSSIHFVFGDIETL